MNTNIIVRTLIAVITECLLAKCYIFVQSTAKLNQWQEKHSNKRALIFDTHSCEVKDDKILALLGLIKIEKPPI